MSCDGWPACWGAARDAEVMRMRLSDLLATEPADLVVGPVVETVDQELSGRYLVAHAQVVQALDGQRYVDLLRALDSLVDVPGTAEAHGTARDVLPRLVRRRDRRLRKALHAADKATDAQARDLQLHEARKQAKATRYAAEAVQPPFTGAAQRYAATVTTLQEVLGEHQDSVVTREVLRELGAASTRSGRNGFTLGRLHALEQFRAAAGSDLSEARRAFDRHRVRTWLG